MEGYFRKGWKCLPDKYLAFSLTFPSTNDLQAVTAVLGEVIQAVLTAINEDVNNIDVVTILSMISGSVRVSAAVTPTAGITPTTSSSLLTGLAATTTYGGLATSSIAVSVLTAPTSVDSSSSSSSSSDSGSNAGMVAGVVVGTVVFIGTF